MASKFLNANTDVNLGTADDQIPSQNAVKTYVDNKKLENLPDVTISSPQNAQVLKYDSSSQKWVNGSGGGGGSVEIDNITITENTRNEIQTIATLNQNNTTEGLKTWSGTLTEFNAIATKDANTLYYVDEQPTQATIYQPPLFATQWSDHVIEDMSWLRADDFNWYDGTLYSLAYQELQNEYDDDNAVLVKELIEPNYSVTGSPTISGTVASNFSNSNYLTCTGGDPISAPTSFEIGIKITTGASSTNFGRIFSPTNGAESTTAPFVFCTPNGAYLDFYNGSTYGMYTAKSSTSTNTTYWFKWVYDGDKIRSYYSMDGITYTLNETKTPTFAPYFNSNTFSMGCRIYEPVASCVWNGSIDLAECYMDVNGDRWLEPYKTFLYKRTPKGYKISKVSQEDTILSKYNTESIAWYYILDTNNMRFKLPRTKFGFEGLRSNVGDNIDESLPNITGNFSSMSLGKVSNSTSNTVNDVYTMGAIYSNVAYDGRVAPASTSSATWGINAGIMLDASRSSSAYQNNAPVQERATQMYLYFYVGGFATSAIQQVAGQIGSKANIDATNFNTSGKELLSKLGMPSTTKVTLTTGASGTTYTAPANGYFTATTTATNQHISWSGDVVQSTGATVYGWGVSVPILKGRTTGLWYDGNQSNITITFIYAEGDKE